MKTLVAALIGGLLAAAIPAHAQDLSPKPLPQRTALKASVPFAGLEAFSALYLAKGIGEFEAENLDVSISVVPASDMIALLERGGLDFSAAGWSAAIFNAADAGATVRLYAGAAAFPETSRQGFWLKKDLVPAGGPQAFDPCALKGKLVAPGGSIGNATALSLSQYLRRCNVKLSEVRVSNLTGADVAAALQSGAIDMGFLPDPVWKDADQRGYAQLLIPFGTIRSAGYFMGKLPAERPEIALAVIRALARTSTKYLQGNYKANPRVREALIAALGSRPEVFDAGPVLRFDPLNRFDPKPFVGPLQQAWLDAGGLLNYKAALPDARVVDMALVDKLAGGK